MWSSKMQMRQNILKYVTYADEKQIMNIFLKFSDFVSTKSFSSVDTKMCFSRCV